MPLAGRNLNSLALLENEEVVLNIHGQFAFEHVEELARVDVGMADLAGSGRHEFFDNAEIRGFDEVPAVAIGFLSAAPFIMFGGFDADYLCRHV